MRAGYPHVIAHRGASRAERENTLVAFHRARDLGADAVELDVRRTADGDLAVHHDPRLPDGRVLCEVATDELPDHVPLLGAALDACAGMWVNIEVKNDPAEPDFDPDDEVVRTLSAELERRGEDDRWLISAFRRETVEAVRRTIGSVRTAWLTVAVPEDDWEATVTDLVRAGHHAVHPWVGSVTATLIEISHRHGLEVNTWTCDDVEVMRRLVDWGIDGICTNVPDVAVALRPN